MCVLGPVNATHERVEITLLSGKMDICEPAATAGSSRSHAYSGASAGPRACGAMTLRGDSWRPRLRRGDGVNRRISGI